MWERTTCCSISWLIDCQLNFSYQMHPPTNRSFANTIPSSNGLYENCTCQFKRENSKKYKKESVEWKGKQHLAVVCFTTVSNCLPAAAIPFSLFPLVSLSLFLFVESFKYLHLNYWSVYRTVWVWARDQRKEIANDKMKCFMVSRRVAVFRVRTEWIETVLNRTPLWGSLPMWEMPMNWS